MHKNLHEAFTRVSRETGKKFGPEMVSTLKQIDVGARRAFHDIVEHVRKIRDRVYLLYDCVPGTDPLRTNLRGNARYFDEHYFGEEHQARVKQFYVDDDLKREIGGRAHQFEQEKLLPFAEKHGVVFKSGGVKAGGNMSEKFFDPKFSFKDLSRGRLVADNLEQAAQCIVDAKELFGTSMVVWVNRYDVPVKGFAEGNHWRPYLACDLAVPLDGKISYEIQIMTKKAEAVGEFNHEVSRTEYIWVPNRQKTYITGLTWAAHMLDYEEYVPK